MPGTKRKDRKRPIVRKKWIGPRTLMLESDQELDHDFVPPPSVYVPSKTDGQKFYLEGLDVNPSTWSISFRYEKSGEAEKTMSQIMRALKNNVED